MHVSWYACRKHSQLGQTGWLVCYITAVICSTPQPSQPHSRTHNTIIELCIHYTLVSCKNVTKFYRQVIVSLLVISLFGCWYVVWLAEGTNHLVHNPITTVTSAVVSVCDYWSPSPRPVSSIDRRDLSVTSAWLIVALCPLVWALAWLYLVRPATTPHHPHNHNTCLRS